MVHVTNISTAAHCLDALEQNVLCLQVDTKAVINFCSVQTQFEWYTHCVRQSVQYVNDDAYISTYSTYMNSNIHAHHSRA